MRSFRAVIDVALLFVLRICLQVYPDRMNRSIPAPVAYPIAALLDYVLGAHEANTYKKAELKSFLQFHRTGEEPLRDDEINILNGVLELNTKKAEEIMTPIKDAMTLSSDTILDHRTVDSM